VFSEKNARKERRVSASYQNEDSIGYIPFAFHPSRSHHHRAAVVEGVANRQVLAVERVDVLLIVVVVAVVVVVVVSFDHD